MDLCCECQASGQELTLNSLCLSFWKKEDSCLHNIIPTTPLRLWGLVSGGIIQDVVRVQIPAPNSVLVPLSRAVRSGVYPGQPQHLCEGCYGVQHPAQVMLQTFKQQFPVWQFLTSPRGNCFLGLIGMPLL